MPEYKQRSFIHYIIDNVSSYSIQKVSFPSLPYTEGTGNPPTGLSAGEYSLQITHYASGYYIATQFILSDDGKTELNLGQSIKTSLIFYPINASYDYYIFTSTNSSGRWANSTFTGYFGGVVFANNVLASLHLRYYLNGAYQQGASAPVNSTGSNWYKLDFKNEAGILTLQIFWWNATTNQFELTQNLSVNSTDPTWGNLTSGYTSWGISGNAGYGFTGNFTLFRVSTLI